MRKESILEFIKAKTKEIINNNDFENGADALEVALALRLDRANVSKELNKLWKDGKLVKIVVRPVLFLDLNALQNAFPYSYIPSTINKNEKLSDYLQNRKSSKFTNIVNRSKDNIDKMIGSDGTLKLQVEQAKAAISYPPSGLHALIVGNPGSGKLMFANYMLDYAIAHEQKEKSSKFIRLNCQHFRDNPDYFLSTLVGNKGNKDDGLKQGYFEKTNGGILYLDNIHFLSNECIDVILGILERNQYTKVGDNKFVSLGCSVVLSCSNKNYQCLDLLEKTVPVTINLPDIDDYLPYEKVELILETLAREAKSSGQLLRTHKDIIVLLSAMSYEQNLTELRNKIKLICSKAYLDTINRNNSIINISFSHLPSEALEKKETLDFQESSYNRILSIIPQDYIFFDADGYCEALEKLQNASEEFSVHRASQFLNELRSNIDEIENVDSYIQENISCMQYCGNAQLNAVKNSINPIVNQIVLKHLNQVPWFNETENSTKLLYGIMLHVTDSLYHNSANNDDVKRDVKLKSETNEEYLLSYDIYQELSKIYKTSFTEKEYDFLAMYLTILKQWLSNSLFLILIISHGKSLAEEYAKYALSLKPNAYIDYINIDGNLQLNDILELACSKVMKYDNLNGVVILNDGTSLQSIGDYILKETGIKSKTLCPISFKLISHTIDQCKNKLISLDSFDNFLPTKVVGEDKEDDNYLISPFIDRLSKNFIEKSVSFIDVNKAIPILYDCLNNILNDLNIAYSDEIGVKYFCHSIHMLERSISKDPLEYDGMKSFINNNKQTFDIVENGMKQAGQTYGIKIPLSELCFLTEMFMGF